MKLMIARMTCAQLTSPCYLAVDLYCSCNTGKGALPDTEISLLLATRTKSVRHKVSVINHKHDIA